MNISDIASEVRLAVDSGNVVLGANSVAKAMHENKAKLVIAVTNSKQNNLLDIEHMAKIAGIKVSIIEGTPNALGAVCGKPYQISMLAIIDEGNSKILEKM
ncbi:MAG: 50S ribosomal protein L30e [Candidatus Micrarchaeaceae archaeon]